MHGRKYGKVALPKLKPSFSHSDALSPSFIYVIDRMSWKNRGPPLINYADILYLNRIQSFVFWHFQTVILRLEIAFRIIILKLEFSRF